MGLNSPDVNLDLVPKTISELLAEVSAMDDVSKKLSKLNGYLHLFGDEMRKIEAFKRELPLSLLLLKDAIERLKEEAMQWKEKLVGPTMEEFMPSKSDSNEDGGAKRSKDCSEMKNWMSSVKLWNTDVQYENSDTKKDYPRGQEGDGSLVENMFQLNKCRRRRGAFVPFKGQSCKTMEEDKVVLPVEGLSLSIDLDLRGNGGRNGFDLSRTKPQKEDHRKHRRCWSPELHRRFVAALQQLGGAQAATPKQIRELMKVDGLTNDEVKSHLQKYRLHIRKMPAPPSACPSNMLLVARDQLRYAQKTHIPQSGSPQGPLYFVRSAKGLSITCGDSMEEENDEKLESHS